MVALSFNSCNNANVGYKDKNLTAEERANDLLKRMTLDEKVAQLIGSSDRDEVDGYKMLIDNNGNLDTNLCRKHFPYGLGHINRSSFVGDVKKAAVFCNQVQAFFTEHTRLGIPVLMIEEGLHGHMADSATCFPSATALASTWNTNLVEKVFSVVAKEMRLRGGNVALSPVLDVGREPRWGRFEETFGEDPYLISEIGLAAIKGFQGEILPVGKNHVAATIKHFVAHGQPESGLNCSSPNADERTLREILMVPFKKAVQKGNVLLTMVSYNEINGVPMHANSYFLKNVLRNEWGFKGIVISDGGGIRDLITRHNVAKDTEQATILAMKAGVEMELPGRDFYKTAGELVLQGKLSEKLINDAVFHILYVKFQLGLFENSNVDPLEADSFIGCKQNSELAREVARQAIILLKNENRILPIDITKYKRIAVIGPNADECILGGYSKTPKQTISPLQGIINEVGAKCKIDFSKGCKLSKERGNWFADNVSLANPEEDFQLLNKAIKVAENSDIIILCLGENESIAREGWSENHRGDKADLNLVGMQTLLTEKMLATGKPVIVALFNNGPLSIKYLKENVPAILECWYLGQETGNALADILFGKFNPGGKLPASIPQSVGHLPVFYNYKNIARRGYNFESAKPLFPFGYGISYTEFKYSNYSVSPEIIGASENINVAIDVTNIGDRTGEEVVQLYIHDKVATVTRPVKELKDFCRISIRPKETKRIQFTVSPEKLSFYDINMHFGVELGEYEIMVGSSSEEYLSKTVTIK